MAEKWIQKAIKKPGALRASLGAKPGKAIPKTKLAKAAKAPGKLGQRPNQRQQPVNEQGRHQQHGHHDQPTHASVFRTTGVEAVFYARGESTYPCIDGIVSTKRLELLYQEHEKNGEERHLGRWKLWQPIR